MAKKGKDLFSESAALRLPKKGKMLSFEHIMGSKQPKVSLKVPKTPKMKGMMKY